MSHLAAISSAKGTPLEVVSRPTPEVGPKDILIEVHAIALNPIDHFQRDIGMPPITHHPSVLGSDISGIVISTGSSTSTSPGAPRPGTRVAAFAPTFYTQGAPDSGAFQKVTTVPASNVTPIPDSLSFTQAAMLPMAVLTTFSGLYAIGLPRDAHHAPADRQGLLVWGGASSVGSAVVQVGRSLGFTVYAVASERHAAYLRTLGAARVFDYKSAGDDVVDRIVGAAGEDGVEINWGYDAVGQLEFSTAVLARARNASRTARLASAVRAVRIKGWEDGNLDRVPGVEVRFVAAPAGAAEREEHFTYVFNVWLREKLASGEFVPSPGMRICPGGLHGLNEALDELRAGVSGTKLVLEI